MNNSCPGFSKADGHIICYYSLTGALIFTFFLMGVTKPKVVFLP